MGMLLPGPKDRKCSAASWKLRMESVNLYIFITTAHHSSFLWPQMTILGYPMPFQFDPLC